MNKVEIGLPTTAYNKRIR